MFTGGDMQIRRSGRRYEQAGQPPFPRPIGSSVFGVGGGLFPFRWGRRGNRSRVEAELAHPRHVVLYPERARQLPAAHPEDVELIDIPETPASRRMANPFPQVGPRAPEMRGHLLAVGDQADDLHPEVGEGVPEGPDPAACGHGELHGGYFIQHIEVAAIDRLLNQAPDRQSASEASAPAWLR